MPQVFGITPTPTQRFASTLLRVLRSTPDYSDGILLELRESAGVLIFFVQMSGRLTYINYFVNSSIESVQ